MADADSLSVLVCDIALYEISDYSQLLCRETIRKMFMIAWLNSNATVIASLSWQ